jgi:hypothetical protein
MYNADLFSEQNIFNISSLRYFSFVLLFPEVCIHLALSGLVTICVREGHPKEALGKTDISELKDSRTGASTREQHSTMSTYRREGRI